MIPIAPEAHGPDQFRLFVESVRDYAIFLLDPAGTVVSWNAGAERIKGYRGEEIVGRHFSVFYTAEDLRHGKPGRELEVAAMEGRVEDEGWRVRKDGSTLWASVVITAIRDGSGALTGFGKVTRDLTERKHAEDELRAGRDELERRVEDRTAELVRANEAMRDSERRLRTALAAGRMGAWAWDIRANRSVWNEREYELLDLSPSEGPVDSERFFERVHQDDLPALKKSLAEAVEQGTEFRMAFRIVRPGGKVRWLAGAGCVSRDETTDIPTLMYGVNFDITEQKEAEAALRASEERFRAFMDHTPAQVWIDDEDGVNRFANPALARELRRPVEEIVGRPMSELLPGSHLPEYLDSDRRVIESGESFQAIVSAPRHDGEAGRFLIHKFPLGPSAGGRRQVGGVAIDVTERECAVEALRASEERYRTLFETAPDGIAIIDPKGYLLGTNSSYCGMFGYTQDELAGRHVSSLIAPSDQSRIEPSLTEVQATSRHHTEWQLQRKDGIPFVVEAISTLMPDGNLLAMIHDITERKRTEAALRASEERLRLLVEGVKDYAIYTLDATGMIETWNAGAARLYGYTADEIIGQHRTRLFTAEDVASGVPRHELELAAASGNASEEGWRVRKDGSRFWANGTMYALYDEAGGVRGFAKVVRDLTERKRAEAELRMREERFRSLVTALSQIVWTTDAAGENHVTTPTWAEYTGLPEAEVRGRGWVKAVHPDDRERAAARWRRSLETRGRFETDYRILRADGEWRHFNVRGVPLLDDDGAVREWVGVCEDDTVRRQAEEGMRLRDRAIQAVSQGILITDSTLADNPIIYASRGFEGITGYVSDGVLGRNCRFLQGQDTDPATVRVMHEAVLAGRECAVEVLNYKQDGTPFWNALFMTPVRDDQGKLVHFVGVQADVTERRGLERALQQSQKMEAAGRLAGGVAHDFNNLLTVISGFSDLLLMEMPPTSPHRGHVVQIRQAGERAAELTRQLLAFSRKQVIQPVVLDLNDVVAQTEKMLRRLLGEDIAIAAVLSPTLPRVKADPGQVDQVVMNLCVNARDAMPTGGRLTIETNEFVLEEEQSAYPDLTPGRYAQLSVSDTGHGMTENVKAQIFEPFFTTKEPGKGTGLGLATVFGIVKQSNGRISVYSEVGVGTTFKILFPAVDAAPPRATDDRPSHPLRGTETILLVEDEDAVRKIARISLETQGYKVLEAGSGTDAILKADQHPGPIHLVVTDVVMPEMGGRQLAGTLRVRYPGVKVLFMSGYTDDAVIRHGIIEQSGNFLQKPFAPLGLAKKVRSVLDQKE